MRHRKRSLLILILLTLSGTPRLSRGAETFPHTQIGVNGSLPDGWVVSDKEKKWQQLPAMTIMLPRVEGDPYQGRLIFVFETVNWICPMTDAEYVQRCRDWFGVFENRPRFDDAKPCKIGPFEALVHHTTSMNLGVRVELTQWMKRFGDQAMLITFIDDSKDAKTTSPLVDKFLESLDFLSRVGIEAELQKKDETWKGLLVGTWSRSDRRGGGNVTAKRTFLKDGSFVHDDGLNPPLRGTWQLVRGIVYIRFTKSDLPSRSDVIALDDKVLELKELLYPTARQYRKTLN